MAAEIKDILLGFSNQFKAIKTTPQVLACGKGRRHLCGSILLFVFVFVFNAEENIDTILLLTFNKENITWPNGVVNAEEEDHMLGWVDVHHLFRTNIRFKPIKS